MISVEEVLGWTGGRLVNGAELGSATSQLSVRAPARLGAAKGDEIAFFFSPSYKHELVTAAPGILITAEPFIKPLQDSGLPLWRKTAIIACSDPYLAMAILSEKFASSLSTVAHLPGREPRSKAEVHPTAVIASTALLGEGIRIGSHCMIEAGARIGNGVTLYPGCFIGPEVEIGDDSVLFPRVSVYENCKIGKRARLHAGVVIGADGFGYSPIRNGEQVVGHQKIYHLGNVVIGDDVEIGANSCVDRATFGSTRIGSHVKLDNLVQIGHNVSLDEGAILCGCSACAGTSSVGKYAYVGGGAGIANQVHVGDRSNVGAYTLVTKDVTPGETVIGNPMREAKEYFRIHAMLSRLLAERKKGKS